MKYAYAILGLAAGLVAAQEPACATPCFSSAFAAVGCAATNSACVCASASAIQSVAVPCLLGACDQAALSQIQASAGSACAEYSATVGQTTAAASTTAPAASTTATVAESTTTAAAGSSTPGGPVSTDSASASSTPSSTVSSNGTVTSAVPTLSPTSGSNFVAVSGLGSVLALIAAAVVAL